MKDFRTGMVGAWNTGTESYLNYEGLDQEVSEEENVSMWTRD